MLWVVRCFACGEKYAVLKGKHLLAKLLPKLPRKCVACGQKFEPYLDEWAEWAEL